MVIHLWAKLTFFRQAQRCDKVECGKSLETCSISAEVLKAGGEAMSHQVHEICRPYLERKIGLTGLQQLPYYTAQCAKLSVSPPIADVNSQL